MISSVGSHVPFVAAPKLHQLVLEVRKHGPDVVFDNRAGRAEAFRRRGDEESAQEAEREAGYILDVLA